VDFDIFVTEKTLTKARACLRELVEGVQSRLEKSFYGMDSDYPLEKVVGDHFRRTRNTLAIAESCTGGMLSARLTDIPGSSGFLLGGVVSYNNRVKQDLLAVPADMIKRHGAVSSEVAGAMAAGARRQTGASVGLSITGIAGPGGATPQKPVGLVFIGLSKGKRTQVQEFHFTGSRDAIRQRSVIASLDWLRRV
jgi:nicotinamide-nucleotide amidase